MFIISGLIIRIILGLCSWGFAIAIIVFSFNLIDIDQLGQTFNLSKESVEAIKVVFSRIQEVTSNVGRFFTQIAQDTADSAGVDINIEEVKGVVSEQVKKTINEVGNNIQGAENSQEAVNNQNQGNK